MIKVVNHGDQKWLFANFKISLPFRLLPNPNLLKNLGSDLGK